MELESGSPSVDRMWIDEAGGARATAAPTRLVARAPAECQVRGGSIGGSTHTPPETWATTSSKAPARDGVARVMRYRNPT